MQDDTFWKIIDESRGWKLLDREKTWVCSGKLRPDESRREDILIQNLALLSAEDILAFAFLWTHHVLRASRDHIWGAAFLIGSGCSDDCFDNWVRPNAVLLGKNTFNSLIADPDTTLATLPNHGEELFYSETRGIDHKAYEWKTGLDFPHDRIQLVRSNDPPDVAWDESDLPILYPKLWTIWGRRRIST